MKRKAANGTERQQSFFLRRNVFLTAKSRDEMPMK